MLARNHDGRRVIARRRTTLLARDLDAAAEVDRPPFQLGLAELSGERERLVRVAEAEPLVTRAVFDRGVTQQRVHPLGTRARARGRVPRPASGVPPGARCAGARTATRARRAGAPQADRARAASRARRGGCRVPDRAPRAANRRLRRALRASRRASPRLSRARPLRRDAGQRRRGSSRAVGSAGRRGVPRGDERLLDQPREQVGHLRSFQLFVGAHDLRSLEREAAREDGQAAQQDALRLLEQLVAPVERSLQSLLPRRRGAAACTQQPEAVVEAVGEGVGRKCVDPGGSQLERERQSVEPMADAGNRRPVPLVEHEPGHDRAGPVDEEPHGLVVEQRIWQVGPVRVGNSERGNTEDHLRPARAAARGSSRES